MQSADAPSERDADADVDGMAPRKGRGSAEVNLAAWRAAKVRRIDRVHNGCAKDNLPPSNAPWRAAKTRRTCWHRCGHHASESMGSAWAEKGAWMRAMYLYEAPLHLLRALTVPLTPDNTELARPHWNNGFEPPPGAAQSLSCRPPLSFC